MSIRPVDLSGMIQRTQDVGNIKQTEDNKPVVEQHNLQFQQVKQEDASAHQVQNPQEKENPAFRYDAKEKGNNSYEGSGNQKKKKKQQEEAADGKVFLKGQKSTFDMKI